MVIVVKKEKREKKTNNNNNNNNSNSNSSIAKGNGNASIADSNNGNSNNSNSINSIDSNNNNSNNTMSYLLKGDPVPAIQLSNHTVEETLMLYKHRGIAVECCQCGYKYIDKKEKDIWTFDFSICPKCLGFNSFKDYIFGNRRVGRRAKVLISRVFGSSEDLIRFLNNRKYDFPEDISVAITLKFNSKEEALQYLARVAYSREIDAVIEG
ncbi:hypothetical protein [Candidatus Nitrosocaldus islandicus]|uniref:hypothetical protein n=1 Tax=Candidatus Nitrosocaldus islandicus TaxID=2045011 RepID=UPI0013153D2C|nr:hypothetical protein [Candidatus Nitrosocaldus islandicus]